MAARVTFPKTLYVGVDFDSSVELDETVLIAHGDRELALHRAEHGEDIAVYQLVSVNRLAITRELEPKPAIRKSKRVHGARS
jgi:hypothetical protein